MGSVRMRELVFAFSDPEIVLQIEKQSINGWSILPAQSPCKVSNQSN